MATPLSREVWEQWKESDEQHKQRLEKFMDSQQDLNTDIERRLTQLETFRQTDAVKLGIFASIISSLAGAIVAWWRH